METVPSAFPSSTILLTSTGSAREDHHHSGRWKKWPTAEGSLLSAREEARESRSWGDMSWVEEKAGRRA